MTVALDSLIPLDPARGDWQPVSGGESGAAVFRSSDGAQYAKLVPAERVEELEQERDRIEWLLGQGIPGPTVLDWVTSDIGACLISGAVRGVSAESLSPDELAEAWEPIARAVRRLHGLPADGCPFTRNLTETFARAREVVSRGAVNPEFLPDDQQRTPPEILLARLEPQLDTRLAQEAAETVVCHGDLCLPNIILDPDTKQVAGFIDLGRLGTGDRYADIALLLANSRETWPDERRATEADAAFATVYGVDLDHPRRQFYLDLDPLTWG